MNCKKVKFATEKDCIFHIEKMKKTAKYQYSANSYFCLKCSTWHITSSNDHQEYTIRDLQRQNKNLKQKLEHYKKEVERLKKLIYA